MAVHEAEHVDGTAYAYAVLDHDGERELGCVYLRPLGEYLERTGTHVHDSRIDPERTAIVTFWLIDDRTCAPQRLRSSAASGNGSRGGALPTRCTDACPRRCRPSPRSRRRATCGRSP